MTRDLRNAADNLRLLARIYSARAGMGDADTWDEVSWLMDKAADTLQNCADEKDGVWHIADDRQLEVVG